jgi:gliding motility-associated-like protein
MSVKKSLIFSGLLFWAGTLMSQNLAPNGGFESVVACPTQPSQLYLASPWDTLNASADLFSSCRPPSSNCQSINVPSNFAGTASAYQGNNYAGFLAYTIGGTYREYLQVPLIQPLQAGKIYRLSAQVRWAEHSSCAIVTLGMTLSMGPISQTGTLPLGFSPLVEYQHGLMNISNQWILLQGFIIASGGENYLTIGNFRDDAASGMVMVTNGTYPCQINGAYYYIDDVSVVRIEESVHISGPSATCPGVPVTLTGSTNTIGWWSTQTDPNTPISFLPIITVTPQTTTTYYFNGLITHDSITIEIVDPPVVNLGHNAIICEGQQLTLDAYNPNSTYQWSNGATTSSITVTGTGIYIVTVDNGACAVSDTFFLTVLSAPAVWFPSGLSLCPLLQQTLTLDAGAGASGYLWSPGHQTTSSITVTSPGMYSVIKEYANGCQRQASVEIKEFCQPLIFIPKAFSPNGDGINDELEVVTSAIISYHIRIYNRWGHLVFESTGQPWKGHQAPEGVYIHHTTYTFSNSENQLTTRQLHGTILLIR